MPPPLIAAMSSIKSTAARCSDGVDESTSDDTSLTTLQTLSPSYEASAPPTIAHDQTRSDVEQLKRDLLRWENALFQWSATESARAESLQQRIAAHHAHAVTHMTTQQRLLQRRTDALDEERARLDAFAHRLAARDNELSLTERKVADAADTRLRVSEARLRAREAVVAESELRLTERERVLSARESSVSASDTSSGDVSVRTAELDRREFALDEAAQEIDILRGELISAIETARADEKTRTHTRHVTAVSDTMSAEIKSQISEFIAQRTRELDEREAKLNERQRNIDAQRTIKENRPKLIPLYRTLNAQ